MELDPQFIVREAAELRSLYNQPQERSVRKQMDHLDEMSRAFIAASPFLVISTQGPGADEMADTSPRGDVPGFVQVADDRTLLIPDRRGNNRLDTLQNIVANPKVGLLFVVPGIPQTFRVNGLAEISHDPELTGRFIVQGKTPNTVVVVHVREAYVHCSRALVRANLWDPAKFAAADAVPSFGTMMACHTQGFVDAQALDEENKVRVPQTLY
jgi:PPOX class probable FMN-dependent enzyme